MEKIEAYLSTQQKELDAITPLSYCENKTANLILSSFANRANKERVTLQVNANLPELLAFPETEFCALLSNGLENAIMAATQMRGKLLRAVKVTCSINRDKLLIMIENAYAGEVEIKNGIPITKEEGHGFGCRSIATIVDKRNGHYTFKAKDGTFTLRVVLPLGTNK